MRNGNFGKNVREQREEGAGVGRGKNGNSGAEGLRFCGLRALQKMFMDPWDSPSVLRTCNPGAAFSQPMK